MNRKKRWILAALVCLSLTMSAGTTAFAAKTVAKIGSKKYTTLQAAVNKVKKGQTIRVTANITTGKALTVSKSAKNPFTIDFGNKKYKYTGNGYAVELKKGSVTLRNARFTSENLIRTAKGTKLTIPNGTYSGIMLTNRGTVTITGGTFKGTGSTAGEQVREKGLLDNYGSMTIKGGTFNSGKNSTIENRGKIVISGGKFTSTLKFVNGWPTDGLVLDNRGYLGGAVSKKGATATITGGTFTSNSLLAHNCGTLTVKGGTFTSQKSCVFCNSEGKIMLKGGTFTSKGGRDFMTITTNSTAAKTYISGGTLVAKHTVARCIAGGAAKITGGTLKSASTKEPVLMAGDGSAISVTGGKLIGKKTYAWYTEGSGKVTIGKKVKVDTKYKRKK